MERRLANKVKSAVRHQSLKVQEAVDEVVLPEENMWLTGFVSLAFSSRNGKYKFDSVSVKFYRLDI